MAPRQTTAAQSLARQRLHDLGATAASRLHVSLVSRFRNSFNRASSPLTNFGIVGHKQTFDSSEASPQTGEACGNRGSDRWLWFRSPHLGLAARMMRTSEPPH